MAFTTPLFVPLAAGLDRAKEPQLAPAGLETALNVDFTVDGQVRGRPSRSAPEQFIVADPTVAVASSVGYLAAQDFDDTGFTELGLVRVRDAAGERPALATAGRLFENVDTEWVDRGHFACMRSDRVSAFASGISNPADYSRQAVTTDFGYQRNVSPARPVWSLLSDSGGFDRSQLGSSGSHGYTGNSARCGTTTAIVSRGNNGHIYMHYRTAGGAVTVADLASDGYAPSDIGDAPSICCSHDSTVFYVAYLVTSGTEVKVLRVTTAGSVTATYATGTITAPRGLWVDNTPAAGNRVVLAITDTDGLKLRSINATTMVVVATSDVYATSAGTDGSDVVVGCQNSSTAWWAYRSEAGGDGDIVLGVWGIDAAPMTAIRRFRGGNTTAPNSYITWAICHQPVVVDDRVYITLAATTGGQLTATWVTLDLSNFYSAGAGTGPYNNPTLVAQGPAQVTYPHLQPSSAVPLADGTGWGFVTTDWTSFQLQEAATGWLAPDTTGFEARTVWNTVKLSGARSAHAGPGTVFSGSVPHFVAGGECSELGFPFCAGVPGLDVADSGSNGGTERSFSIMACWRWTDAAGQVHRSSPSAILTQPLGGTYGQDLLAVVTNPWLCEKSQAVYIELYMTDANPTADAAHFLQTSQLADFSAASTSITLTAANFQTATEPVYTDGSVLPNRSVRADGGVVAVGRRLWAADANTVYASKYLTSGEAPSFNDFGTHQVNVPAGAGRIISLEKIDDKVIVFCERGVFAIQDGGPDKTGTGADFLPPLQLSDLPIAGPRSSCSTDAGVVFCTVLDATDAARGGPWLIDRQLSFTERQYMGRAADSFFLRTNSWVPEVAYSPERQQVYITTDAANGTSDGVVVLDMRVGKWAVWDTVSGTNGALQAITCANGVLWALNTLPAPYDGTPGTDSGNGAYAMVVKTAVLSSDGSQPLGWGRIRGVRALQGKDTGAHTLTITVTQDGTRTSTSGSIVLAAPTADTTWPTTRQAPEWRLPAQKCSTIQVQLSASPAVARWSGIQLDVTPLRGPAPAKNRS